MPRSQHEIDYTSDSCTPFIGGLGVSEDDVIVRLVKAGMNNNLDDDDYDSDFDQLWDEDIDV